MPATEKSALLDVTFKEYAKLHTLIARIDPRFAMSKDDDDTSIKDVVAHRAHWIGLFLNWHADGQAGKQVHFPAEGYKWNDLPRYNAALRERQSSMGWSEAVTYLATQHDRLVSFIEGQTNAGLYGGPMKGAHNHWTTGRWAEAAGASHYRSAAKYLRMQLRQAG